MKKALYRKYRPTKLSDIIGQSKITETLENAIKNNQISHAYLFTGPRGTGKTSVARIFAHAINDFNYEIEDNYLDIIEIDAASNTGVDNIRELREKATIAPSTGKYKVYIIDEVHMLSKSAFNALLKTLEEPPKHVVFIMATTDAHKVPITITSRAQTYNFKLADIDTMAKYLRKVAKKEKIDIDDEAIELIAKRGGGSFRDSLSLLDQLATMSINEKLTKEKIISAIGLPEDQIIEDLLNSYAIQDQTKIASLIKETIANGIKPEVLAEEIIKRIINHPDPQFFPLLEKLPNVTNPFPEAKLLLSFLKPAKTQMVQVSAEKTTAIKATKNSSTVIRKEKVIAETKEETIPEPIVENITPGEFNFNDYVSKVSPKLLAQTLARDVEHEFKDETLHLYPKNKFIHDMLKKKENEQSLIKALGNGTLKIHDQNDFKKSPVNSKISDIMGGEVEEIKENGGEDLF